MIVNFNLAYGHFLSTVVRVRPATVAIFANMAYTRDFVDKLFWRLKVLGAPKAQSQTCWIILEHGITEEWNLNSFHIWSIYLSYGKANIAIVVTYLKVKGTSLALQVLLLALILAISTEIPSKSWEDMGSAVQVPSIMFSILDP